jgi:hypothetical protein
MSKNYFDIIKQYWDKPHTADANSAVQIEQERIIKLITKHGKADWCGEADCPRPFPTEHIIAIIKGEK